VITDEGIWVSNGPQEYDSPGWIRRVTRWSGGDRGGQAAVLGKIAAGFGSIWVPLCGDRPNVENGAKPRAGARRYPKTNAVVATIPIGPGE